MAKFVLSTVLESDVQALLTHYFVIIIDGEQFAIGEAAEVQYINRKMSRALVGFWGEDLAGRLNTNIFSRICEVTVDKPYFALVKKEDFHGAILP